MVRLAGHENLPSTAILCPNMVHPTRIFGQILTRGKEKFCLCVPHLKALAFVLNKFNQLAYWSTHSRSPPAIIYLSVVVSRWSNVE